MQALEDTMKGLKPEVERQLQNGQSFQREPECPKYITELTITLDREWTQTVEETKQQSHKLKVFTSLILGYVEKI